MKKIAKTLLEMIRKSIKADMRSGRKEKINRIHVSALYDLCTKRIELAIKTGNGYDPPAKLDLGRAFTFKQGRYIQDLIVDSVMKEYPECVLSRWICPDCKTEEIDIGMDKLCPKCKSHMRHNEILLEYNIPDTDFSIVGNIDLCIGIDNKFYPIEIKGLRKEDFENNTPIFIYQYQIGAYLWLIGKADNVDKRLSNDFGVLLYVSKQHTQNPIKGFLITEYKIKNVWSDIENTVDNLKTFSKTGKGKKLCNMKGSPIASKCPYKKLCWR